MLKLGEILLAISGLIPFLVMAGPQDDARLMYARIVGTTADQQILQKMTVHIEAGNHKEAAMEAMKEPDFYNVSLKIWAKPWSNKNQSTFIPLNDYVATVVGFVRDDKPFNEILSADSIYTSSANGLPAYSHTDNRHYEEIEKRGVDMSNPNLFSEKTQSGLPGAQIPATATAGVITTRASGEAYFFAGTNRAMTRFTFMNFMCRDFEEMKDNTLPGDRIRKDIARSPGGSKTFLNECSTCHSFQDGIGGAWAHFEWDDENKRVVYDGSKAQGKMNNNPSYKYGFETKDDSWRNYLLSGINSAMGWRDAGNQNNQTFKYTYGNGAKSLGKELANSKAFSACQVKKVFSKVCLKDYSKNQLNSADLQEVERIAGVFEQNNYNLKHVFAEVANYCLIQSR